jgi:hypothetical protein
VAYKVTESAKKYLGDAPKTAYSSVQKLDSSKTLTTFDSQVREFSAKQLPAYPSQRRSEVQELSKNMKDYNQLKRSIYFENRKNKFSNNRWRDGIAKVITYDKHNNKQMIRIRNNPYENKNKIKNEALLKKSSCK